MTTSSQCVCDRGSVSGHVCCVDCGVVTTHLLPQVFTTDLHRSVELFPVQQVPSGKRKSSMVLALGTCVCP